MQANILVVDDSITHVEMLKMILESENHNVFVSYDGVGILRTLEEHKIDIVLLDVILPYRDGFELLQRVINNEETTDIPVIMVTGLTTGQHVKRALDLGALDYIKKPAEPIEVIARIHSALRLRAKQDQLKEYALKDNVTKLFNRAHGDKLLQKFIKNIDDYDKGISFAMLDCDFFKRINDTFGHVSGDIVLETVANTILKSIKNTDMAYRYGGEEFCIAFPDTTLQEGFIICERVRNNIQKTRFVFNKQEAFMTASIGLTHLKQGESLHYLELIEEADQAMYLAKSNGRNRVEFSKNRNRFLEK